jgi:hypothetical protein
MQAIQLLILFGASYHTMLPCAVQLGDRGSFAMAGICLCHVQRMGGCGKVYVYTFAEHLVSHLDMFLNLYIASGVVVVCGAGYCDNLCSSEQPCNTLLELEELLGCAAENKAPRIGRMYRVGSLNPSHGYASLIIMLLAALAMPVCSVLHPLVLGMLKLSCCIILCMSSGNQAAT